MVVGWLVGLINRKSHIRKPESVMESKGSRVNFG